MSITVTLNVGNNPPVTCTPSTHHKEADSSGEVKWERAKGSDFTFCALEIAGACFTNLQIKEHSITINDDNKGNANIGDYPYTLVVRSADGLNFYSTALNVPDKINGKSTSAGRALMPQPLGNGDPTIKNN
jgi:hypothetical protein